MNLDLFCKFEHKKYFTAEYPGGASAPLALPPANASGFLPRCLPLVLICINHFSSLHFHDYHQVITFFKCFTRSPLGLSSFFNLVLNNAHYLILVVLIPLCWKSTGIISVKICSIFKLPDINLPTISSNTFI